MNGGEGEVNWSNTFDILECCGCNSLSVRHEHWFSEWDEFDQDPITGEPCIIPGIETKYWPPQAFRKKPDWVENIEDDILRNVMDEVYRALSSGLTVLAAIGTRTLLDRAMFLKVGDAQRGFAATLELLVQRGHIDEGQRETLVAITDAGNAAAHRGYAPNARHLDTIVATIENFLHREFVLKSAAGEVRAATPPRRPRNDKT